LYFFSFFKYIRFKIKEEEEKLAKPYIEAGRQHQAANSSSSSILSYFFFSSSVKDS
jgi:hypothetical protein